MRGRLRRGDWVVVVVLGVVLVANLWARAALPARTDALNKLTEAVERNTVAENESTIATLLVREQEFMDKLASGVDPAAADRINGLIAKFREHRLKLESQR